MPKNFNYYTNIQKLRKRYYEILTGKESLIKLITDAEVAEQVYNSNAIENSTLTLEETEKILLQIELDRFVSERELFEAKNLARVVEYTDKTAKTRELDLGMILTLHKMLISNIRDDIAGRFRQTGEFVRVANHIAPGPDKIDGLLKKALANYYTDPSDNIAKRIARLHLEFENIHPFIDGNGRIGRVINNYLLIREGFVPINIKFIDRLSYYKAFKEYEVSKSTLIMEEIVARALTNSYHKRLAYLEDKNIITLVDFAKKSGYSHSNLLNKAKRQTIEAFLEKGIWKIGNN